MNKEYGTALFSLALEGGLEREYAEALEKVEAVFSENPDYFDFLASPGIPMSERLEAIRQAFSPVAPEHIVSFLQLLCESNRIGGLFASIDAYKKLFDAWGQVSKARIVSAVSLTQSEKDMLIKKLEGICGHAVEPEYTVEPSLLGGLLIEMDGKVMDGSLRHRLRDIKDVMHYE
ncbi:MAG: ATP synthase F1 subunit delta [Ruminococcaceae bacterium]|nr:ATP synthase F1 subunit delta [Oscillospiraceae bacterium]